MVVITCRSVVVDVADVVFISFPFLVLLLFGVAVSAVRCWC